MIFDGKNLIAKAKTHEKREKLKELNLLKAKELSGKGQDQDAKKYYQRCLRITSDILYATFDVLDKMKIEFIVAPYEADA